MRWWVGVALLALILPATGATFADSLTFTIHPPQTRFFPLNLHHQLSTCRFSPRESHRIAVLDELLDTWFSTDLAAAREPSLFEQAKKAPDGNSYRFMWLPSFHAPVTIRVDENASGRMVLTAKQLSGMGGFEPGRPAKTVRRPLMPEEGLNLRRLFATKSFAEYRTDPCNIGTDGSQWIVETRLGGKYRFVRQYTPQSGGPVFAIGTALLKMSGLPPGPVY